MEEVKRRNTVIESILKYSFGPDDRTKEEFCLFNFRMICELIALGCLMVHGDMNKIETGSLRKQYRADAIIKSLSVLHPNFYPRPSYQKISSSKKCEEVPITSGYLLKEDLIKLYHKCDNVLHIGSMATWSTKWKRGIDLDVLVQASKKVSTLLNHHQITLADSNYEIWTIMNSNIGGKVRSFIMERTGRENASPNGGAA